MEDVEETEEQKTQEQGPEEKTEESIEDESLEEIEESKELVEEGMEEPTPAEEVEPSARREAPEEEVVEEKIYTVPLGKAWIQTPKKRAPKAIRIIKAFVKRHMKFEAGREIEEEEELKKLIISNEVNERVWRRGIEKPPRKLRVRAARDREGNITVFLAEGD